MKYLGIDYGKRKIGLATSEGETASPFKVIQVSGLTDALSQISAIIEKEKIDQVVIGLPESGEARNITQDLIKHLKKEINVIEVEETLTSQNALNKMIEQGVSKKKRQEEDSFSAAIILQSYLDSMNEK